MRLNTTVSVADEHHEPSTRSRSASPMAWRKAGPRPGHEKIDSVTTAPPSSAEKLSAHSVTSGISALRKRVLPHDRLLGDALRTGGADVVLVEGLEHRGPPEPAVGGDADDDQRERRQEHVASELEEVLTGLAAGVERLEPEPVLELDAEDVLEQQGHHERGECEADEAEPGEGVVALRVRAAGGVHRQQQRDDRPDEERRDGDHRGVAATVPRTVVTGWPMLSDWPRSPLIA